MFYVCSRYYDPTVGRFINSDKQINQGLLGKNLFTYVNNNPINLYDPDGTSAFCLPFLCPIVSAKVAAVVAAVVVAVAPVAIPVIAAAFTAAIVISMFENSLITCGNEDFVEYTQAETVFEEVTESSENPVLPDDVISDVENEGYYDNETDDVGDDDTNDYYYDDESPRTERVGKQNGNTPRNNQKQNKQTKDVAKKYNLSKDQARVLHDEISHEGLSRNDIFKRAYEIFIE